MLLVPAVYLVLEEVIDDVDDCGVKFSLLDPNDKEFMDTINAACSKPTVLAKAPCKLVNKIRSARPT